MNNDLKHEASLYLSAHAEQPVHWQPWREDTLLVAKRDAKPIYLSIGYAGSHWCQVMAEESYSQAQTADILNAKFCCIKVDREERPDLDRIYLTATQLLNQRSGGWPINAILDPDTLVPFFAGHYFPAESLHGQPGFADLLLRLAEAFSEQRDAISEAGGALRNKLQSLHPPTLDPQMEDQDLLQTCRQELAERYDASEGGFGQGIKFAMPSSIEHLLRHWAYARNAGDNDRAGLDMVMTTLTRIARGGIYDHLGGGFFRYATDKQWRVPHFEKVLYDSALLLGCYAQSLKLGEDALFEDAIRRTLGWLENEMRHPEGAFFASQDGMSQGQSGGYYLWRREAIKPLLDEKAYLVFETLYGIDRPANCENKWSLHRRDAWRSVVERLSLEPDDAALSLDRARSVLLETRAQRPAPITDEKILTSWNGLLMAGLCQCADVMEEDRTLGMATGIADFLYRHCWEEHGLSVCWQNGKSHEIGFLEDYANTLAGLLELLKRRWRAQDILFARALADALLEHFYDPEQGGFFLNAATQTPNIYRPKPTVDEALPPGNATATSAMIELGRLLGVDAYLDAGLNSLVWARAIMERYPASHCAGLRGLQLTAFDHQIVILRGPSSATASWHQKLTQGFHPWRSCYAIPYEQPGLVPGYLPSLVGADDQQRVTAFLNESGSISGPIRALEVLEQRLDR